MPNYKNQKRRAGKGNNKRRGRKKLPAGKRKVNRKQQQKGNSKPSKKVKSPVVPGLPNKPAPLTRQTAFARLPGLEEQPIVVIKPQPSKVSTENIEKQKMIEAERIRKIKEQEEKERKAAEEAAEKKRINKERKMKRMARKNGNRAAPVISLSLSTEEEKKTPVVPEVKNIVKKIAEQPPNEWANFKSKKITGLSKIMNEEKKSEVSKPTPKPDVSKSMLRKRRSKPEKKEIPKKEEVKKALKRIEETKDVNMSTNDDDEWLRLKKKFEAVKNGRVALSYRSEKKVIEPKTHDGTEFVSRIRVRKGLSGMKGSGYGKTNEDSYQPKTKRTRYGRDNKSTNNNSTSVIMEDNDWNAAVPILNLAAKSKSKKTVKKVKEQSNDVKKPEQPKIPVKPKKSQNDDKKWFVPKHEEHKYNVIQFTEDFIFGLERNNNIEADDKVILLMNTGDSVRTKLSNDSINDLKKHVSERKTELEGIIRQEASKISVNNYEKINQKIKIALDEDADNKELFEFAIKSIFHHGTVFNASNSYEEKEERFKMLNGFVKVSLELAKLLNKVNEAKEIILKTLNEARTKDVVQLKKESEMSQNDTLLVFKNKIRIYPFLANNGYINRSEINEVVEWLRTKIVSANKQENEVYIPLFREIYQEMKNKPTAYTKKTLKEMIANSEKGMREKFALQWIEERI